MPSRYNVGDADSLRHRTEPGNMSIIIRQATPADAPVIVTFNCLMARETEGKDLDRALIEPGVRAVLADLHKGRYLVAERDGEIVGQIGITFEWSDWRNGWFWWIQSVYVAATARRQGVFRALYRYVEEAARADPAVIGIRLYVERENGPAHSTYHNLGMRLTNG
jgi:GNAT superfamily N-acetyltransferase